MQPALAIVFVCLSLRQGIWSDGTGMLHLADHPAMSALVEKGKKQLEVGKDELFPYRMH